MTFTVVWEGLDGVGKTTLMAETSKILGTWGLRVISYKTPSDTPTGRFARDIGNAESTDPLTRMLLFLANTSADSSVMKKAIAREKPDLLFIDRYYLCSLVYGLALIEVTTPFLKASELLDDWLSLVEKTGERVFLKPNLYVMVTADEPQRLVRLRLKEEVEDVRYALNQQLQRGVLKLYQLFAQRSGEVIWVDNRENQLVANASAVAEKIMERM
ncbi:MAG: hypothetical protein QW815_05275, partial [Nitrososphaerota archaeon]